MASVFQAGHTALITGGASGIGLALAKKCHQQGMKVLVVDRDESLLASVGSAIDSSVETFKMDVGVLESWTGLKTKVQEKFGGKINFLALNAGAGVKSPWDDPASFQTTLATNFFGVVNGIGTFLPAVQEAAMSSRAAIVITGSKQGITNPPGRPAYNASKAAVKSVAEGLAYDLRGAAPSLTVHLLVPGWTFTGMTSRAPGAEKSAGAWWPEQVVDYLVDRMARGEFYVLCPDNDVTEETDKKRMLWSAGDLVERRPPLSRWREDWKDTAQEWMDKQKV